MTEKTNKILSKLYNSWSGENPQHIERIAADGSNRQYYRLTGSLGPVIGTYNNNYSENNAFVEFAKHFKTKGLPVPEIYSVDLDQNAYIQEDLGDITLFDYLQKQNSADFSQQTIDLYRSVINMLPRFQVYGGQGLDFSQAFPHHSFDRRSMMWDLNYFKYHFLKLAPISFDEQALEEDFKKLTNFLLNAPRNFFLYRDFQSANIMLTDKGPYGIDFQGGRKGALQYDIASLLYDNKANIPFEIRGMLLEEYLQILAQIISVDREQFKKYYLGYVLMRLMQAMGAYGFRGFYEQKIKFLQSVPYAVKDLEFLIGHQSLPIELPELFKVYKRIVSSTFLREYGKPSLTLTVHISSFSYERGIPRDKKGHGGGFVFDTRSLPNPYRIPELKSLSGLNKPVVEFLENDPTVQAYLSNIKTLVSDTITNYSSRQFTDLSVAFGCKNGKHRSVYCAEVLATSLRDNVNINIEVTHREL